MMKKYYLIIPILILIIVVISIFTQDTETKNNLNIANLDIQKLDYDDIKIDEVRLKRYNEKLNKEKIKTLLLDLFLINTSQEDVDGYIKYATIYARVMDYNYDNNVILSNGTYLINKQYISSWVEKLFMINIYDKKMSLEEENGVIKIKETDLEETTDTIDLNLDSLKYNKKYDIYRVTIVKCDDSGNTYGTIEIVYKNNGDYSTILDYEESSSYE